MKTFKSSSGLVISYDAKKKDVIQKSLQTLIEEFSEPSLWIGFHCSYSLHNLAYLLKIDEFDESLKRKLLFGLINKSNNLKNASIEDFLELFSQAIHEYKLKERLEFHIIYPINISEGVIPEMSKININGLDLEFYPWDRIKKEYEIESLIKENNSITGSNCKLDKLVSYTTPVFCRVFDKIQIQHFLVPKKD